ncbi:MAG: hypothetical protein QXS76_03490 [Candidatus Bathyarchaeia archaeon]
MRGMKVKVTLKRSYGDIELEGENFEEIVDKLKEFPEWIDVIDSIIASKGAGSGESELLAGVVEYTPDGPIIVAPRERITVREALGILLYASGGQGLRPRDLGRLLNLSGLLSIGFASRLSELRREGLVYKEDESYRLTATGKRWVEEFIKSLRVG